MTKRILLDANNLILPEIASTIPPLYSQEEAGEDAKAVVKFFTPDGQWTWYVIEFDPEERLCFGFVAGLEAELGYFSLSELEQARGGLGLRVERDLYWEPKSVGELRCELQR